MGIFNLDFLTDVSKAPRIFGSKKAIGRRNAQDIKNVAFLYFLTLSILMEDFYSAPWAVDYLKRTFRYRAIYEDLAFGTDLYTAINIITSCDYNSLKRKQLENNRIELTRISIDKDDLEVWVERTISGMDTERESHAFLEKLERSLRIDIPDYRNARKLVAAWSELDKQQRSVLCTRMNFALKKHARDTEVHQIFQRFIKRNRYLIKNTSDPEAPPALKVVMTFLESVGENVGGVIKGVGLGTIVGIVISIAIFMRGYSKDRD